MLRFSTRSLFVALSLLLTAAVSTPVLATTTGSIEAIHVAPDMSSLTIKCQGYVGEHTAAVIGNPYRLVMDFKNARMSEKLPGRARYDTSQIKEVRVGRYHAGVRVVADFGGHPVPRYTILKNGNDLMVKFGEARVLSAGIEPPKAPAVNAKKPSVIAKPTAAPTQVQTKGKSRLAVRAVELDHELVSLDISDTRNPSRKCRLVLELDMDQLKVRRASVSDDRGKLTTVNLSDASQSWKGVAQAKRGPTRGPVAPPAVGPRARTPKWDLPAGGVRQRTTGMKATPKPVSVGGIPVWGTGPVDDD
ncbi:MAG: AMIN domain-containing protein [Thermodesulfobacteriota bacterium]